MIGYKKRKKIPTGEIGRRGELAIQEEALQWDQVAHCSMAIVKRSKAQQPRVY